MLNFLLKEDKDFKLILEVSNNKNKYKVVVGGRADGLAYAVYSFNSIDKALAKFNKETEKYKR